MHAYAEDTPRDADIVAWNISLAKGLLQAGNEDRAVRMLQNTAGAYTNDARPLKVLAEQHLRAKRYSLALETARQVERIDPGDVGFRYLQAEALAQLEHYDDAMRIYQMYSPLDNKDWPSVSNWANCYAELGMYAEAERLWAAAHKAVPEDNDYLYGLAFTKGMLGKVKEYKGLLYLLSKRSAPSALDVQARVNIEKEKANKGVQAIGDKSPQPDP